LLTVAGLLIIVIVVALLLSGKCAPIVSLALVPLAGALLAGFSPAEIAPFFTKGMIKVAPVATMFIFAIVFFGLMQDVGLFAPLVRGLLSLTRGNVIAVTVSTALLGMAAHLDGAGATTFLLTVPALLPLYQRLKMSPYLMLMLLAIGAGMMNLTPWAGPLGRASAVTGIDAGTLWQPLVPLQAIGAVVLVALAILLGARERHRIMAASGRVDGAATELAEAPWVDHAIGEQGVTSASTLQASSLPSIIFNTAIFAAVLASLLTGILPAPFVFMIGTALALVVNFRTQQAQIDRIKAHAPNALIMAAIILTAGAFLGIMDGSGMLKSMANDLVRILPSATVPYLHLILGVFGLPMELVLSTDAYYFGLLPIVHEIVGAHGVSPLVTVHAMAIGNSIGTFISPFSPALWLALGLAGLDMGKHIRYSIGWMWTYSLIMMGLAVMIGLVPLSGAAV
jgi:CitMHS family citrate-Mg2+:H+ or citrate-Ca2+:H+ symporter